ncbi:hypothetical protein TGRUB_366340, partial [Toxoplasma gondii RUB]
MSNCWTPTSTFAAENGIFPPLPSYPEGAPKRPEVPDTPRPPRGPDIPPGPRSVSSAACGVSTISGKASDTFLMITT